MIQKPDKFAELAELYRSISLLPVLSKLFEKPLCPKLFTITKKHKLILDYLFGFKRKYTTIKQIYRIIKKINNNIVDTAWRSSLIFRRSSTR